MTRAVFEEDLVSTVIPVFNRPALVRDAVRSVLEQTHDRIEIILVDDGSTDTTPTVLESLRSAAPDRIRVERIDNGGPGVAREVGRGLARGEFLQYLDSDDLLHPAKFARQVAALRRCPKADIAYGITELVDADGRVLESPHHGTGEEHSRLFPALLKGRWWNTHTPLYRRELCDRIGPWPTQRTAEDWHYDALAACAGARLVRCDGVVSFHRRHDQGRLTGTLDAAGVRNTTAAMSAVFDAALSCGGYEGTAEREFFARAAFLNARRADAMHLPVDAGICLDLAGRADVRVRRQVRIYRALRRILGTQRLGRRFS